MQEIVQRIEEIKEFGDVPAYVAEVCNGIVYVCRNNGVFHRGDECDLAGRAVFIGAFTQEQAIEFLEVINA
jgi:hypothetical protein